MNKNIHTLLFIKKKFKNNNFKYTIKIFKSVWKCQQLIYPSRGNNPSMILIDFQICGQIPQQGFLFVLRLLSWKSSSINLHASLGNHLSIAAPDSCFNNPEDRICVVADVLYLSQRNYNKLIKSIFSWHIRKSIKWINFKSSRKTN